MTERSNTKTSTCGGTRECRSCGWGWASTSRTTTRSGCTSRWTTGRRVRSTGKGRAKQPGDSRGRDQRQGRGSRRRRKGRLSVCNRERAQGPWLDFQGITRVSERGERAPGLARPAPGPRWPFGTPSAGLSLVGLRPRRARLRFTRQRHGNQTAIEKQEQERSWSRRDSHTR
jgi:hypothetical protein